MEDLFAEASLSCLTNRCDQALESLYSSMTKMNNHFIILDAENQDVFLSCFNEDRSKNIINLVFSSIISELKQISQNNGNQPKIILKSF
jgi:hypothetical protein